MDEPEANSGAPKAPSRSTVYVSNLPFSLTNTDLHSIFGKFGKLVKVTIMRDKETRRSRGVAFLLYLTRTQAVQCVAATHNINLFGRTLCAHLARDNGKAAQFVRRREYPDKSRCYECGEFGHLSYSCPKNVLGNRDPPKKKPKKRKNIVNVAGKSQKNLKNAKDFSNEEDEATFDDDSLSAAIRYSQELRVAEDLMTGSTLAGSSNINVSKGKKRRYKQSAYFSDEEEEDLN